MKFVVTGIPRRQLAEHVALGDKVGQVRVGGEAAEVQLLGGVGDGGDRPRRQDLLEGGVPLGPERGAPRIIEGVDVAVTVAQPSPERRRADVAVAVRVVAGVLVADVPHLQRWVVTEPLRQGAGEPYGGSR